MGLGSSWDLSMGLQNLLIPPDGTMTPSERSETMLIGIFMQKTLCDASLGLLGPPHVAAEPPDLPPTAP